MIDYIGVREGFMKPLEEIFQMKNTTNSVAHKLKLAKVISSNPRLHTIHFVFDLIIIIISAPLD
uniref:Uncharacterized protein n=1 Tax=Glossina palpalis gambiensis TaxID=67801 RepID=A0A1B0AZ64_9MUSC